MKFKKNDEILKSIKNDAWIYISLIIFLIVGTSIGAIAAKTLDFSEKKSLLLFINNYFLIMDKGGINNFTVFYNAMKRNFQPVFFIWLFSITAVGIPVILFIVSFFGFIIGFTVAFFVEGLGIKGLLFIIIAVLPQNIIYIPCLIVVTYLGIKFSINIVRKYLNKRNYFSFGNNLTNHTIYFSIMFLIMGVGALLEAYLSPTIIKAVGNIFIVK